MTKQDIEKIMTACGVKVSPVRVLIMECLSNANGPMSAQELETALDTVDRSSISRSLNLFAGKHLIHTVEDGSGSVKYELCRNPQHAAEHICGPECDHAHGFHTDSDLHPHFHCLKCGKTYCLDKAPLPPVAMPAGFRAVTANYVIKGVCPHCNK